VSSVRRTLLAALLLAMAAATFVGAWATYRVAREQLDTVFDYHLRQIAYSLSDRNLAASTPRPSVPGMDFAIQIWGEDGVRLYLSRPDAPLPRSAELGFSTVTGPAGRWRIYAAVVGDAVIQVGQPLSVREDLAVAAAIRMLFPLLLLLPAMAFAIWKIVSRGLRPLDRLARAAAARTPAALDPFPEAGVPEEALPLVRSLNGLLGRLRGALEAQRAFVADAAHELKTPLAALKLQLQLLERAEGGAERTAALADLAAGLDRETRLVHQLLTLARVEPEAAVPSARVQVSLAELVREAVAEHALLAEAKGIDLGAGAVGEAARTVGDPAALRTLLGNLVDNAIRYTPAGGRVDVSVEEGPEGMVLEVADSGPGIPAGEHARIFDRFYRLPGADAPGSGLGLAIVKAVADRHGARVLLRDTAGGGLTVRVVFARAVEAQNVA
jgi:two-component system OmpR family sensor kinase